MKKYFIAAIATLIIPGVPARTLNYGDASVELTDEQKTFPALHVKISDEETVFGALYDVTEVTAPENHMHIEYDDNEYWVGPWCEWWPHLINGKADCVATYKLANKFLTLDEVNQYIIPTDISQWELVSACSNKTQWCLDDVVTTTPEERRNAPECACAIGTLAPGLYLFHETYHTTNTNNQKSQIAIFSRPVGYMIQHSQDIAESLIDTEHATFQTYTLRTPDYNANALNDTNISGLPDKGNIMMYVYRLR